MDAVRGGRAEWRFRSAPEARRAGQGNDRVMAVICVMAQYAAPLRVQHYASGMYAWYVLLDARYPQMISIRRPQGGPEPPVSATLVRHHRHPPRRRPALPPAPPGVPTAYPPWEASRVLRD